MSQKENKRSGWGTRLVGGLALAVAAGGYLYYKLNNLATEPLPKALEADLMSFESDVAGELFYYVDKRRSGRPLLLLHSINAAPSSMEIRPLFDHYRQERPVYSLDLPGVWLFEAQWRTAVSARAVHPGNYRDGFDTDWNGRRRSGPLADE